MNNKQYEIITKTLLSIKNIPFKYQKTDDRYKFVYENIEYYLRIPSTIEFGDKIFMCKNGNDFLIKLNQIIKAHSFNGLIENISFFDEISEKVEINNFQINILFPNRQKTLWYESCYSGLEGGIFDFNYKGKRYVFSLEEKELEFYPIAHKTKKNKSFTTAFFDEEKLSKINVFSDKDIKITQDAYVFLYKNNKEIKKMRTSKILETIKSVVLNEI